MATRIGNKIVCSPINSPSSAASRVPVETQTEANNRTIKELRSRGREHCFLNDLPYPRQAQRSLGEHGGGPALAIEGIVVYFRSDD